MNPIKNITIDVDFSKNQRRFIQQLFKTQIMLNNLKPCFVRHSSSKNGLHALKFYYEYNMYDEKLNEYKKFCQPLHWLEEIYDDPKRKLIREIRIKFGLTSSVLFDLKSFRNISRVAGEWQFIQDAWEVERFLDFFYDFWRD